MRHSVAHVSAKPVHIAYHYSHTDRLWYVNAYRRGVCVGVRCGTTLDAGVGDAVAMVRAARYLQDIGPLYLRVAHERTLGA